MCLENVMRGSGDLGAMLGACYGVKMLDRKECRIQIECVKDRDFEATEPFQLTGRPHIDETGDFKMTSFPTMTLTIGESMAMKKAAEKESKKQKEEAKKFHEAVHLFEEGLGVNAVAKKLHVRKELVGEFHDCWEKKIAWGTVATTIDEGAE